MYFFFFIKIPYNLSRYFSQHWLKGTLNLKPTIALLFQDSLVDLVSGLGIPKEKLILSFSSHAYQFQLANASVTLPQSPALGAPKILTPAQMCKLTKKGEF